LCVSARFEKVYCWCFEKIANFFLSFSLFYRNKRHCCSEKNGGGGGFGDGGQGGDGDGGQGKVAKEQIAKEKRKALDVKSAGTQHRHPRGKSPHI
jgi:hypothetical protein